MTTTTPAQIKAAYEARNVDGSRNFFNFMVQLHRDTMRSYGVQELDGQTYLYRKADTPARKWVRRFAPFPRTSDRGPAFFDAWRFDPETADLHDTDHETAQRVWDAVYRRG